MYLRINRVIKIKKLLDILNKYHNFKINKEELFKYVDKIYELFIDDGKYICVSGLDPNIIDEMLKYKEMVKKYKIIDEDINEFNCKLNTIEDKIVFARRRCSANPYIISDIRSMMYLSGITHDTLAIILYEDNAFLSNNVQKDYLRI